MLFKPILLYVRQIGNRNWNFTNSTFQEADRKKSNTSRSRVLNSDEELSGSDLRKVMNQRMMKSLVKGSFYWLMFIMIIRNAPKRKTRYVINRFFAIFDWISFCITEAILWNVLYFCSRWWSEPDVEYGNDSTTDSAEISKTLKLTHG